MDGSHGLQSGGFEGASVCDLVLSYSYSIDGILAACGWKGSGDESDVDALGTWNVYRLDGFCDRRTSDTPAG